MASIEQRLKDAGLSRRTWYAFKKFHPQATLENYIRRRGIRKNLVAVFANEAGVESNRLSKLMRSGMTRKDAVAHILADRAKRQLTRWLVARTGLKREIIVGICKTVDSRRHESVTARNAEVIAAAFALLGTIVDE